MNELLSAGVDVGIIVGFTQALKLLGLPKRYAPITAIATGVCFSFLVNGVSTVSVVAGIIAGLVSSGLYSGVKTSVGK